MTFAPDQRISLQPNFHLPFPSSLQQESSISSPELGLFFNYTEYNAAVIRFQISSSIGGQPFILSKELSEWGRQSTIDHSHGSPGFEAISQGPKKNTPARGTDRLK